MIKSSDSVKAWRRNIKLRAIEAAGEKCQSCGYNACPDALDFHHIDPSQKEFALSRVVANPKSQDKIATELEKCILLCSNCHREFHAGFKDLPETYTIFDREIFLIKSNRCEDNCPICGQIKSCGNITCSLECAGKRARKVDWDSVDLYELKVNQKLPNTKIGNMLGISDVAVKKRLIKLGLI